jgi:SAM-dependent methyltransferase
VTHGTERRSVGDGQAPADACYGIETRRAIEDFPISGLRARVVSILAIVAVLLAAALSLRAQSPPASSPGQSPPSPPPARHGRLFPPQDLGLLEGPDRDVWQKPDRIMDALGIAEGSVVADLGAGGGWFTVRLARRVGPNGLVYAEDIQRQMIESIGRRVGREGLTNVRTVLGTPSDPALPSGTLDAILIVNTYREMEDPVALLSNAAQALKPRGQIGILDYKKDGLGPGPPLEERVDPEAIVRDAGAAGLRLLRRASFLPYQFFLIFGK